MLNKKLISFVVKKFLCNNSELDQVKDENLELKEEYKLIEDDLSTANTEYNHLSSRLRDVSEHNSELCIENKILCNTIKRSDVTIKKLTDDNVRIKKSWTGLEDELIDSNTARNHWFARSSLLKLKRNVLFVALLTSIALNLV